MPAWLVPILHVSWVLLGWPAGIILGNLLASVVWSFIFEWRLRIFHRKNAAHVADQLNVTTEGGLKDVMDAVQALHDKLDAHLQVCGLTPPPVSSYDEGTTEAEGDVSGVN